MNTTTHQQGHQQGDQQGDPASPSARRYDQAAIEADASVPAIHIWRDFRATPAQLLRAHTDPELFVRWVGPQDVENEVVEWDARDGGAWRYTTRHQGFETAFRGCFHTVREDRIVQTFTWEGMPDAVSLETMMFEDLGDGRTRLHAFSLCDSFEGRDQWLASGMEVGVNDGYAKLDRLVAESVL
ncbi:SRPBCC domain-containing protein [Nocardioides pantholopis]|uniref:SRPBCC domain-containing protein n=1 Tax=Nocardioides pantholopis TaxID=2483798 RepID=UPI000FD80232|nr:SRPBCC domain-containing protein [Nocardioides pantholopis]